MLSTVTAPTPSLPAHDNPTVVRLLAAAAEAVARAEAAEQSAREAQSRAASIEGERDRLAAQVAALIERIPNATAKD